MAASKPRLSRKGQIGAWHSEPFVVSQLQQLEPADFKDPNHVIQVDFRPFSPVKKRRQSWDEFFRSIGSYRDHSKGKVIHKAQLRYLEAKSQTSQQATHHTKRKLVLKLDINQDPYDVLDAIRDGQQSIQLPGGTVVDLVRCDTLAKPKFKSYHHMFDCENPDANSRCPEVVNEATGFFVVEPGRSIVFYSGEPAKVTPSSLELVIIRRTAMGSGSDTSNQDQPRTKWFCPNPSDGDLLYQWIRSVVELVCDVRRNQRLTHEGEMTQFGLTNGSRHTRHHKSEKGRQIPADATITSFGWGVSYRKKLLEEDCRAHDADVNGAGGIVWSLIAATMPQSVIQEVTSKLSLHKVPHLVSRYIAPGKGYRIKLNEREYVFPDADRAPPPQLFMTWGYSAWSHTDPCYATWAFNLNVGREQYETATSDSIDVPAYGGANFVDVSLQVVVVNSAGTLMAFKPSHHHGTTVSGGTTNYYITFAFSKDISDALDNPGDRSYLGDCSWET